MFSFTDLQGTQTQFITVLSFLNIIQLKWTFWHINHILVFHMILPLTLMSTQTLDGWTETQLTNNEWVSETNQTELNYDSIKYFSDEDEGKQSYQFSSNRGRQGEWWHLQAESRSSRSSRKWTRKYLSVTCSEKQLILVGRTRTSTSNLIISCSKSLRSNIIHSFIHLFMVSAALKGCTEEL